MAAAAKEREREREGGEGHYLYLSLCDGAVMLDQPQKKLQLSQLREPNQFPTILRVTSDFSAAAAAAALPPHKKGKNIRRWKWWNDFYY